MSGRTFLDTNVLVYLFSSDEPDKQSRALAAVDELGRRGDAVISTQVMQELYAVLTRKLGLDAATAARCVESIAWLPVVESDGPFVMDAIRLAGAARLSIWDALVVAAAQRAGCTTLLTEDLNAGQRFGDVVVRNPFD